MKKITLVFALSILLLACKDKKKNDPEPEPTPTPTVPLQFSVKINGSEFNCTSCGNTYRSGNLSGVNFSESLESRFIFSITGFLSPGTYTLAQSNNTSFSYEKDGHYYRGNGTLNLTQSDTSANGSLKKFIGTFSCKTDTFNGQSYDFTEGVVNINFK